LSPEESEFAKYLQQKEITPEEVRGYYIDIEKLRKEYDNRATNSELSTSEKEEVTKAVNRENIHPYIDKEEGNLISS